MIDRRQVAFLDVVAGAGSADAARQIDTEAVHRIARPAAAVALQLQRLLGTQNTAAPRAFGVEQEIALLAEQPESVADLPRDMHRTVRRSLRCRGGGLCRGPLRRQRAQRSHEQCAEDYRTDTNSDHDAFDVTDRAEIRVSNPRVSHRPGPARIYQTCSNRRCRTSVSLAFSITRDSATAIRSGSALP